jgi:predicted site-specific integrase-resolvase
MQSKYPEHEIISEIASGVHYDRQGIRQILEYIKNKQLKSLAVAHKDRLTRFSFDIWQHLAEIYGFKLVVENNENESPETEIVKDIIAIVTSFAARIHGLRKYIPRKSKVFKNTNQVRQDI